MPPSLVNLTIDGRKVAVRKGTTILEAARQVGSHVPHYCYHPGLSSPAMCRLCLVEVEGASKPMPSCVTTVQEGQVVRVNSEEAVGHREGVLEFYLVNHPLDCPICDMSGECDLQDYVHYGGRERGRSQEPKRVFGRDDFGGDVLFYGDRCVMCTRCVRFMSEVEGDERLTVVERGDRAVIDTFFEEGLEGTNWHGNIVDICPVGALLSKDFLHKARAWDLEHSPSVCTSCSQGCNVELHVRDNLVQRIKPRENLAVNGWWMCDHGRHNYEWMNRGGRLQEPYARVRSSSTGNGSSANGSSGNGSSPNGAGRSSWSATLSRVRDALIAARGGAGTLAVASPFLSNEDLAALVRLVDALGGGRVVYRSRRAPDENVLKGFPQLARRRDLAPNTTGLGLMGAKRVGDDDGAGGLDRVAGHDGVVIVVGDALHDQMDDFAASASAFIYAGSHAPPSARSAHALLPVTTFAEQEGSFTNLDGRVQRFSPALIPPGSARPPWFVLGALAASMDGGEMARSTAEAFAALSASSPAFAGLDFEALLEGGAMAKTEPARGEGR
ncbi:MAG: (2Fe-2S)-binding protein [Gemmatimonadetes bacterium]|nr:(2Fe-2S)-binding protein [Gemmatimonadota bacterium]